MSRLIDEINKAGKSASPPLGFRTARQVASAPRMVLIAGLSATAAGKKSVKNIEGADAVLIDQLQPAAGGIEGTIWGGRLQDAGTEDIEALITSGCDYFVFSGEDRIAAAPDDEKAGSVLQVATSLDDMLLRTVNDLPVDAVLAVIDGYDTGGTMPWHYILNLRRLDNLISKPIILGVPSDIVEAELKALWDAGVDAVIVAADKLPAGRMTEIRGMIDNLPARAIRKGEKAEAILPRLGGEPAGGREDEDDDDDWDDD